MARSLAGITRKWSGRGRRTVRPCRSARGSFATLGRHDMLLNAGPVVLLWLVLAVLGGGCSSGEVRVSDGSAGDYKQVALTFTKALAARDYGAAYALTSTDYRGSTSVGGMQAAFERIVPLEWKTVGPIEVSETMDDWPGREPSDVGWAYVSVGGDVYSEAVTVVVTLEAGVLKVRRVEFGRP